MLDDSHGHPADRGCRFWAAISLGRPISVRGPGRGLFVLVQTGRGGILSGFRLGWVGFNSLIYHVVWVVRVLA
jgi:hypothetical protein